jgi:glycosyltransferase involved in cell wall biosynthesis
MKNPKVIVVLTAHNSAKTLERTVRDIPENLVDEIILVDDFSHDDTCKIAEKIGLTIFKHDRNKGYGGNQKTCYKLALEKGADIIAMLHPDYQYDPKILKHLVEYIKEDYFDVMLGTRIRSKKEALAGGMPIYKYYSNRFLTFFENLATGHNLSEWHTGMRAYKKEVLENIDFLKNSDDFFFDSQMLFKIIEKGYKIGEVPVPVRYFDEASSISFSRSLKYGIQTLGLTLKYGIKFLFK